MIIETIILKYDLLGQSSYIQSWHGFYVIEQKQINL